MSKGGHYRQMTFRESWLTKYALRYRYRQVFWFITGPFQKLKERLGEARLMRYQLRWAWAKLGCKCHFDKKNRKVREESHCPIHGWYGVPPEDPDGWENVKL